jgi:hypothetical protein
MISLQKEEVMKKLFVFFTGIIFLISILNAQTWQRPDRLTWNSENSNFPSAASDSNHTIHLVWQDETPGNAEIFYRKSTDTETTWSILNRLTWNAGESKFPMIAIDSSDIIHMVWQDDTPGNREIYYKNSIKGGSTWSSPKRLTWMAGDSENPVIVIDSSDTIHVFWQDVSPGNAELFYKKSTDSGSSWTVKRITWSSGHSIRPAAAVDSSDNILLVWVDRTPGNYETYFKKSTDSGTTWLATNRLTWTSAEDDSPAVTTDSSNNIHIVWQDDTEGEYELHYKRSTDSGSTWTKQRLTWTSSAKGSPFITVDMPDYIHIVWGDNMSGNFEIYHKKSTDTGNTWTQTRLTWTADDSVLPILLTYSEPTVKWIPAYTHRIFVFWSDFTPGNYEIYLKSGTY